MGVAGFNTAFLSPFIKTLWVYPTLFPETPCNIGLSQRHLGTSEFSGTWLDTLACSPPFLLPCHPISFPLQHFLKGHSNPCFQICFWGTQPKTRLGLCSITSISLVPFLLSIFVEWISFGCFYGGGSFVIFLTQDVVSNRFPHRLSAPLFSSPNAYGEIFQDWDKVRGLDLWYCEGVQFNFSLMTQCFHFCLQRSFCPHACYSTFGKYRTWI